MAQTTEKTISSVNNTGNYSGSLKFYITYKVSDSGRTGTVTATAYIVTVSSTTSSTYSTDYLYINMSGTSQSSTNKGKYTFSKTAKSVGTKTWTFTYKDDGTAPQQSISWNIYTYHFNKQSGTWTFTPPAIAKQTYTISFAANGGTGAPSSQTKTYGTNLTLSSTKPTRANSTSTASETITVKFNTNGGSPSTIADKTGSATNTTTTKYTFTGWKATDGTIYQPGASYTKNEKTTMTAQWSSSSSTVRTANPRITLPAAPTKEGYKCLGWGFNGAMNVPFNPSTTHTIGLSDTYYPIWRPFTNAYIGIDDKARELKNIYIGINGKARKIEKIYVGVNGKARLCYEAGG